MWKAMRSQTTILTMLREKENAAMYITRHNVADVPFFFFFLSESLFYRRLWIMLVKLKKNNESTELIKAFPHAKYFFNLAVYSFMFKVRRQLFR